MRGDPNLGGMPYERCSEYYLKKPDAQKMLNYMTEEDKYAFIK